MAKRYYWLKLKKDFFTQPKIRRLRSMHSGADLTIIYLKMLLLSLEDEGVIYLECIEDDIESELEMLLDEDVELIKETLNFLKRYNLVEIIGNEEVHLTEAKQSVGSESDGAQRVRKYREKEKLLHCNSDVTNTKHEVTNCNIEIEKDIDKEIDIELDIEIKKELEIEKEKEVKKEIEEEKEKDKRVSKGKKEKENTPKSFFTFEHDGITYCLSDDDIAYFKNFLSQKGINVDVEFEIKTNLNNWLNENINNIQKNNFKTSVLYWLIRDYV